ncbi:hypothetical protein MA16_Dca000640 [Dendrobium catenatum]|uniref:Uncharacterized protein n=1 Tax=Dendrobium catenatum TaxID=906689 RepID=A0A2I0WUF4_9ASPA|nr:hypothetical protein MA16_Dca000640 [Dendrobium catenatum]
MSGDLAPASDSDRGVESDLSRPESYLAATSFHAQITENDSVPSQEEIDVEQAAARLEEDVVNDEEAYDLSEPMEASTVEDEDPVEEKSFVSFVMVMKESNTPISIPTSAPARVTPFNTRRPPFDRGEATTMVEKSDYRNGDVELNDNYIVIAGVEIPCINSIEKINSVPCIQAVRRNVNKGWDLKFELSGSTYGSKENGKLVFYGPTATIEEQGIKELDMRPGVISSLLHFTDLKGSDNELVMQWLRKPSIEHFVVELYINNSTLSIRGHGDKEKTTLL